MIMSINYINRIIILNFERKNRIWILGTKFIEKDPNSTLEQKIEKCQTGIGEHGGSGEENSGHELEHLGKRRYLNL